jgi:hypothetical protein
MDWLQGKSSTDEERTQVRDEGEQRNNAADNQMKDVSDSLLTGKLTFRVIL